MEGAKGEERELLEAESVSAEPDGEVYVKQVDRPKGRQGLKVGPARMEVEAK